MTKLPAGFSTYLVQFLFVDSFDKSTTKVGEVALIARTKSQSRQKATSLLKYLVSYEVGGRYEVGDIVRQTIDTLYQP